MTLITTRTITTDECPWLDEDIAAGTLLVEASDPYRCCTPTGVPVHLPGETRRYVEVPRDAVTASA